MSETTPKVYEVIRKITEEMSHTGISKDRKNQQQGYSFRGIDDVYAALSPMLAKHGLCILPRVISREQIERETKSGNALFYTLLTVEFDFVAVEDGSKHVVCTVGEAMDSADKSSNKAQSAAFKYAAFQAFAIPVEGDNDADAVTHEVAPQRTVVPPKAAPRKAPEKPAETPKPQIVPEFAPIKQFLTDAGLTKPEHGADAALLLKYCHPHADIAKAKANSEHANLLNASIALAIAKEGNAAACLAAAKKLASSPV